MELLGLILMFTSLFLTIFWLVLAFKAMNRDFNYDPRTDKNILSRLITWTDNSIIASCISFLGTAILFLVIGSYLYGGTEYMLMIVQALAEGAADGMNNSSIN